MKNRRLLLLATIVLLLPAVLAAQTSDFHVVPVSVHAPGVNGTFWMSDVVIHNYGTTPLEAELVLIRTGLRTTGNLVPIPDPITGATTVTIAPGGTRLLADVLGAAAAAASISGAIMISGNQPFAVTSRLYNRTPTRDTIGQTVIASTKFLDHTMVSPGLERAAHVPGIVNNARYRTNLGFVAASSSATADPLILELSMRDQNGAPIGEWLRFAIPSGGLVHLQYSSRAISARAFDVGTAKFRIVSGEGSVVPYASVIDNATGDAAFLPGQFHDPLAPTQTGLGAHLFRDALRNGR